MMSVLLHSQPLLKVLESTVINLYIISTLTGTTKATTDDALKLNTLKGTRTTFLTPTRYDVHPRHFYMGVPPPGPNIKMYQGTGKIASLCQGIILNKTPIQQYWRNTIAIIVILGLR